MACLLKSTWKHLVTRSFIHLQKSNPGAQNSVTSPILTQAGLALLQYGATGRTREDIGAVCGAPLEKLSPVVASLKSINSERTAVEYVSSLFVNNDAQVNRTFSAVAEQAKTRVVPVNFRQPAQTVQIINSWVSQSTRAAIPSILDPSMCQTRAELYRACFCMSRSLDSCRCRHQDD